MKTTTTLLAVLLSLSGCSTGSPVDGVDLEALTDGFIRARSEVPEFGGVSVVRDEPVVLTFGEVSAALPVVRSIFGEVGTVRTRAAFGGASEALKDEVSRTVFDTYPSVGATYVDFDERIGYVRLGVANATGVARAYEALDRAGLPTSEVVVEVIPPARDF